MIDTTLDMDTFNHKMLLEGMLLAVNETNNGLEWLVKLLSRRNLTAKVTQIITAIVKRIKQMVTDNQKVAIEHLVRSAS